MAQDEQVVADLRVVQARASAMDRLLGLELPALDRRMDARGGRAALPEVLAEAIDNIGDRTMRAAAQHLFPLPYGPTPWETGKARGTRAAGEFGVSYDAFRKRGDSSLMRDQQDARVLLRRGRREELQHLFAGDRVQGAGRLVGEDNARLGDQGSGDGNALRLAA